MNIQTSVENQTNNWIYGGDGDDLLQGSNRVDYMYGEGGADDVYGRDGDDFLYGGDGADYLAGNDRGMTTFTARMTTISALGRTEMTSSYGGSGNDTMDRR